jgi:hypothetical protein
LIALFYAADHHHLVADTGYRQLVRSNTRLLMPLPIVFEVYKRILHQVGPQAAQAGLQRIRGSLEITYPQLADLDAVTDLIATMPTWRGSLEDALVAVTGLSLDVPVWTLNYRDLATVRNLHFWTPATA